MSDLRSWIPTVKNFKVQIIYTSKYVKIEKTIFQAVYGPITYCLPKSNLRNTHLPGRPIPQQQIAGAPSQRIWRYQLFFFRMLYLLALTSDAWWKTR